jgi:aconitate hydratase
MRANLSAKMFRDRYANVFQGDKNWQSMGTSAGLTYKWQPGSTYVKHAPYFEDLPKEAGGFSDIKGARPLAILGDSITTDHISPAGSIKKDGPAGNYLIEHQVRPDDFNSFGARRGNHEIMMRGTFANIRLKNEAAPGTSGGMARLMPEGKVMSIYEAAVEYKARNTPLVIFAGKEYGTGSSRDWAAKGTMLLGVKAVVVESFERIHRSNLVGMGVLPLQFPEGTTRQTLKLDGSETVDISGIAGGIQPRMTIKMTVTRVSGEKFDVDLLCRIDTLDEVEYYRHGGILPYVLRGLLKAA